MVNFIICDDNKEIVKSIVKIINKEMMNNELSYKNHIFYDYDKDFLKMIKSELPLKIYILDIETPSGSGIDIARKIREKDIDSIIIFLTSHLELGYTILKSEFMFLSFICKFDDYKNILRRSIKRALELLGKKKVLKFEERGSVFTIPLSDILYICRDTIDRKCIIHTNYNVFGINKKLAEMVELLSDDFKQSHRSCIVNMDRVVSINYAKKVILFDNGKEIDLISPNFRKEVSER